MVVEWIGAKLEQARECTKRIERSKEKGRLKIFARESMGSIVK